MNSTTVLAFNPGSTSTKIAMYKGEKCLFKETINHDAKSLAQYKTINDQLPYRESLINDFIRQHKVDLSTIDAFVGRGGALMSMEAGTYLIDEKVYEHSYTAINGVIHPANLGVQIAYDFANKYDKPSYMVNPPTVDELHDLARLTGIKGVYRRVHLHALNLKETAIRHSAKMNKKYEDCNYIVAHIGGGISISAHRKGRMIDGNDIVGGEGPIAPTRAGSVPLVEFINYSLDKETKTLKELCTKSGGFVDHLGISDSQQVVKMAKNGNKHASLLWESMIYQIEKNIGSMASVLCGEVDAILLSGGMVYDDGLVNKIKKSSSYIAEVFAYPGEFEMEALAAGAIRVLEKKEVAKTYTGKPVWTGFDFIK